LGLRAVDSCAAEPKKEKVMAKGQMRTAKEKKKPKAEWNKDKKKGDKLPRYMTGGQPQQNQNPFEKKS
jgi:hypothetical protein